MVYWLVTSEKKTFSDATQLGKLLQLTYIYVQYETFLDIVQLTE